MFKAWLRLFDAGAGVSTEPLPLSSMGQPIIPSRHDKVVVEGHFYVVQDIVWAYDLNEPSVVVHAHKMGER